MFPPRFAVGVAIQPGPEAPTIGSAVFIAPDLLLTCRHVVWKKDQENWSATIQIGWGGRGDQERVVATVYRREVHARLSGTDLAILQIALPSPPVPVPPWACPPPGSLRPGDWVVPLGFPGGRFDRSPQTVTAIKNERLEVDGDFAAGTSGGVVQFDRGGFDPHCFGVVVERLSFKGFALGYRPVKEFLEHFGLTLPTERLPERSASREELGQYRDELRKVLGTMELGGFTVMGQQEKVPIEKLWVPSYTRAERAGLPESSAELLSQAIDRHRRLLIVAEAGYGKTTFLRRAGYALLRQDDESETVRFKFRGTPFWVPLKRLERHIEASQREGGAGITQWDDVRWMAHFLAGTEEAGRCGLSRDYFQRELASNENAVVFLDGFDEIALGKRADFRKMIETAAGTLACRIVVSTRPEVRVQSMVNQGPIFRGFSEVPLLPMRGEEIAAFIRLWCGTVQTDSKKAHDQEELLRMAVVRPGIRDMADNPLMLTAMAVLTANGQALPESRAKLFEAIVNWLIQVRPLPESGEEVTKDHLSYLALGMIERESSNPYEVSLGEAVTLLQDNFVRVGSMSQETAARRFLEAVAQTGLVNLGNSDKSLRFWHRYLQEYLAANCLRGDSDARAKFLKKALAERRSPEVFRLVVGLMGDSKPDLCGMLAELLHPVTTSDLEAQAYALGLIGSALADLRSTGLTESVPFARKVSADWEMLRSKVLAIFDFERWVEVAGIALETRVKAAEALGQGGDPRLCLPGEEGYWVRVSGGSVWTGAQKVKKGEMDYDPEAEGDEKLEDPQPRRFGSFRLGKYPVTVYEYEEYLRGSGRQADAAMNIEEQSRYPNRPLVSVTHGEATRYCEWISANGGVGEVRLPTEWEWEYAARGRGSKPRRYAWGDEPKPDGTVANFDFPGSPNRLTAVGLFPRGSTPGETEAERIHDLAGNVFEWTGSHYDSSRDRYSLRGGCFDDLAWYLRAARRYHGEPGYRSNSIGFRCLRE